MRISDSESSTTRSGLMRSTSAMSISLMRVSSIWEGRKNVVSVSFCTIS